MPAPSSRRLIALVLVTAFGAPHASASAQIAGDAAQQPHIGKLTTIRLVTPLLSGAWSQTRGTPTVWKRTWGGYGSRLGDGYGYLVVKTGVQHVVGRAVPWGADVAPCITRPLSLIRETATRAGCAIARTTTLRTTSGDRRPNLPLFAGAVVGTFTSLSWRPERQSAVSSRSFVIQRFAITYGTTALVRLVADWRADAKQQPRRR